MTASTPHSLGVSHERVVELSTSSAVEWDRVLAWACVMTFKVWFYSMVTIRKSGLCVHRSVLMHTEVEKSPRESVPSLKSPP